MRLKTLLNIGVFILGCLAFFVRPDAAQAVSSGVDSPVNLSAKTLVHNNNTQQILADGAVEMVQDGRILRADRIVFDLHNDLAYAMGNVVLLDKNGDVYFAEEMELKGDLREGFVKGLRAMLSDGSNFRAEKAERIDSRKISMENAFYTPCKLCPDKSDKDPLWQIRADKVVYDEAEKDISYRNARLEILGLPIMYTPIFSHPDPRQKQKSGFLRPKIGWTSDLGVFVRGSYYWGLARNKDATFSVQPTSLNGVLTEAQYRQHFHNGFIELNGGLAVNSDRVEESGIVEPDKERAHIFANGRFDHSRTWRSGFDLNRTSDKGYLRLYDIDNTNVLESQVFAERFSNRDYTRIEAVSFQDVRLGNRLKQPDILPLVEHRIYGAPGGLLGGRWTLGLNAAGLHRQTSQQDTLRASVDTGWERQFVSAGGIKTVVDANIRGDAYHVRDSVVPGLDTGSDYRFFPYLHAKTGYPLVKPLKRSSLIIEPMASVTLAHEVNDDRIVPNEDSIDVQLDSGNLFDALRFPGLDRVEDRSHAAYGIKTGIHGHQGRKAEIFVGQSVQLDHDPALFPAGSGLEDEYSDLVGAVNVDLGEHFALNYKAQFDDSNLKPRRHEVQMSGNLGHNGALDYDARYVFATPVAGTGFPETREQVQFGAGYRINESWRTDMTSLTDLGTEPGFRRGALGLHYTDECFSFSIIGQKNLIDQASGENDTTILFRIGLKHLGEFSTPEILLEKTPQNGSD